MPGVITEAELRELWQNGRGAIPPFPPDTRFSPAARDFLRDHRLEPVFLAQAPAINPPQPLQARPDLVQPASSPGHSEPSPRRPEPPFKRKTIYTQWDIEDLARSGAASLVIDEEVVLTELAQERAQRLGMKLVREKSPLPSSAVPISHNLALLPELPRLAPDKEPGMGKTVYTDADIEALHQKGLTRLELNDAVVLTDLAREKAHRLGMELVQGTLSVAGPVSGASLANEALFQQVKSAVMSRLGGTVNERAVEAVIRKVLAGLK